MVEISAKKQILVQPWFPDAGHPAQVFLNLYRALHSAGIEFEALAFGSKSTAEVLRPVVEEIKPTLVAGSETVRQMFGSLITGTILCHQYLHARKEVARSIFYIDASPYTLGLASIQIGRAHV